MPSVLVIAPGIPASIEGRSIGVDGLTLDIWSDPNGIFRTEKVYDLVVLCGMDVDEQQRAAARFQEQRRWRLVPILYVIEAGGRGFAIPGGYRPEMDSIVRGSLDSLPVQRRIRAMARDGIAAAEMIVAGPFELDPVRGRLRIGSEIIELTEREAGILGLLLAHPNRTVLATEIIERGWGTDADGRYLQILRRHVSNIRRKLDEFGAGRCVRTVRGSGYLFHLKGAELDSRAG